MTDQPITFTPLRPDHLDAAHGLSQQAGWKHRREDWAMMLPLSRGVAAVSGDKLVGTALTTLFGDTNATINMVIVEEGHRGHGVGRRLMDLALAHVGERTCRLIATEDGMPLYEKLGFQSDVQIDQCQGIAKAIPADDHVRWADAKHIPVVHELDRAARGMDRGGLIDWLVTRARIDVFEQDGTVHGYASLRPFGLGEVIGPVVAANEIQAKALIGFLLKEGHGRFLRLDTPAQTGLADWLGKTGLTPVYRAQGMIRPGETAQPTMGIHKVFGLASQALT